ncbi:MAG: hypothetical protein ACK4WH_09165 [Phycisphaerales bacterium]
MPSGVPWLIDGDLPMPALMTDVLLSEYETVIVKVGEDAMHDAIIAALVREGDWTEPGAREVLQLARSYGTGVLRNALALAAAMGMEDGDGGL